MILANFDNHNQYSGTFTHTVRYNIPQCKQTCAVYHEYTDSSKLE